MMTSYDDVVMRTIIELPPAQLEALGRFCDREGISRAEAIRRAVTALIEKNPTSAPSRAFGLWRRKPVDGLAYQRRLRREWA
ncbi:MAG: ribbon-helix-helix protein, CopG family [Vicinamibacterales bacterium]